MADAPADNGSREHAGSDTGTPRWVKVFGIIALVVGLLLVSFLVVGGRPGGHGPGRHTSSGDTGGRTPASIATESGGLGADISARGGAPSALGRAW